MSLMLYRHLLEHYDEYNQYNCAERMLHAANDVYNLGLDDYTCKVASGFGGGMAVGSVCGALTGAIMVLGLLFVETTAHQSIRIKALEKELLSRYKEKMGDYHCAVLAKQYATHVPKCQPAILEAAKILDDIIAEERAGK